MNIIYHHRTQGEEPESIHILAVVEALTALGNEVVLVGPSKADMKSVGANAKGKALVKRMVHPLIFELIQILYNFPMGLRLLKQIRHRSPDFIYERYALYAFIGALLAKLKGIPLILEVNTPYAYAWSKYYQVHFPRFARWLERWIIMQASRVITVTEVQRQFLIEKGIPSQRITVCHNAINPADFNESSVKSSQDLCIGFVGTMNRWQGVPTLKQVIPKVCARVANARFLLIGGGEYLPDLKSHLDDCGLTDRVHYTGRVPHSHALELLRQVHIAILPDSNDYGSPMKIFEYGAVGAAVVAPLVGPVSEVLRDGKTAILVQRANADELANGIICLAENEALRVDIARSWREEVLAKHTWSANAEHIISIYKACVGRGA